MADQKCLQALQLLSDVPWLRVFIFHTKKSQECYMNSSTENISTPEPSNYRIANALNEFLRTEGQKGLALPISLRHEFPSQWHRFLHPPPSQQDSEGDPTLTMNLGPES
jgi:hypothetical protein